MVGLSQVKDTERMSIGKGKFSFTERAPFETAPKFTPLSKSEKKWRKVRGAGRKGGSPLFLYRGGVGGQRKKLIRDEVQN